MTATPASATFCAVSALLCSALDVGRPDGYSIDGATSQLFNDRPLLLRAYRRLYDLDRLRQLVLSPFRVDYFDSETRRKIDGYETDPGIWAARLVYRWPIGFQAVLLRLAKLNWRNNHSMLISIPEPNSALDVIDHLCTLEEYDWLDAPIRNATLSLLRRYKAPLQIGTLVIFSPHLSIDVRERRLQTFARWWRSVCAKACAHGAIQFTYAEALGYPPSDIFRNRTIVSILSSLIDAATAARNEAEFGDVLSHWPHPLRFDSVEDAGTLVGSLAGQLAEISTDRLDRIEVEVDRACQRIEP